MQVVVVQQLSVAATATTTTQHIASITSLRACTQRCIALRLQCDVHALRESFTCVYGPAVPVGAAVGAVVTQHMSEQMHKSELTCTCCSHRTGS
jgi:hypothetical protein